MKTIPLRASHLGALTFVVLTAGFLGIRPEAHIVPPENLHPVTESYRRMGFLLNLNPVLWNEVGRDAVTIADGLEAVTPMTGQAYRSEITGVLAAASRASGGGMGPMPADERKATAKTVFRLSTGAVIDKLSAHLELAEDHLDEYGRASLELGEARQLWAAFEPELRVIDSVAFLDLGRRWLELSSALGSPGVFGAGAVAGDRAVFEREAASILDFLDSTYRPRDSAAGPELIGNFAMAALPASANGREKSLHLPARLPPGSEINKQLPRPRQVLNMATRGVDEGETHLIALGDMAFDSPEIFGEPARSLGISCNTCHNKSITNPKFFIPGLSSRPGTVDVSNSFFAPHASNGHFDPLDIPDLRGIRFTAPYGRNGRFDSLREFSRNVIVNEFNGAEPDPVLLDGLMAYMLEFDFLPNPDLLADGSLSGNAPQAAKRGEEIFHRPFAQMGGRSCASCHDPSDHFLDRKRHDVGTVKGAEDASRDRALDTPTLLSASYTPPYFHDGSAPSLKAVSEHFNDHYGLGLKAAELDDLTAYVATVGSGVEAYEDTIYTLDAELEEFSFFLSPYEFLRGRGKTEITEMTFKTVAFEIQAHKWDIQDPQYLPVLDRLSALMNAAWKASRAGEGERVDEIIHEYRELYEENKEVLQ